MINLSETPCSGCSLCCIRCGMELHSELYDDLPNDQWPAHTCGPERGDV